MRNNESRRRWIIRTPAHNYLKFATAAALAIMATATSRAWDGHERKQGYRVENLVSDQPSMAMLQDTNLVNAWGISSSPTSPFWVSDNGSGRSTLYSVTNDESGMVHVAKIGLEVSIPGAGNPTGQVFNDTGAFNGDNFIFVAEDGTISGWRNALGNAAEILVTRSNSVYKGVTLVTTAHGPMLLAANFSQATVDAFDTNMTLVGQFSDPHAPDGYAPFNVQSLSGIVFVTFAKQDEEGEDDVPGPGHGLIDILNPRTGVFHRFVTGSDAGGRADELDSPWGLALAPRSFGRHADELLVGNFGSGTIMSFDARGHFRGFLEDTHRMPIVVDGLWALKFGNGGRGGVADTLYFSAGPGGEAHGLFGSIEAVRNHHRGHGNDDGDGDHDGD